MCLSADSYSKLALVKIADSALVLLVAQFPMFVLSRVVIKSRKGCAEEDTIPSNREANGL